MNVSEALTLSRALSETVERLREMARNLEPDDFLFVAQRKWHGRRVPLGEDGMSQLIGRLLARAGLKGFTAHYLRRTFATLVITASNDEFLAMRLIRDKIPGQSDRYIRYPMDQLVEALEKYSPIRQAGELPPTDDNEGRNIQKVSSTRFPVNAGVETVKESGGDGGGAAVYNLQPTFTIRLTKSTRI